MILHVGEAGWLAQTFPFTSAPIGWSLPAWLGMSATTRRVRRVGYLRHAGADPGKKGLRHPGPGLRIKGDFPARCEKVVHRISTRVTLDFSSPLAY